MSSLFDAAGDERRAASAPLAHRLRPRSLDDVVGQQHLVGPEGPLRKMAQSGRLTSFILYGPPGTGKTSIARLIADIAGYELVELSAVSSGVKDVREVLDRARRILGEGGRPTCLFIDEVHRFNKAQQDLLLPATENGLVALIGATTENPFFEVNAALLSRSTLWRLHELSTDDLAAIAIRGAGEAGVALSADAVSLLVAGSSGDARNLLTTLDVARSLTSGNIGREHVALARDGRHLRQSSDTHYDQVSAFIKSMRGSDPDAAVYWLVALLESGESPRFLARRMVIFASEDIGMADPLGLLTAEAAARAVEFVGMPEASLTLVHCALTLALMEKSNSATEALGRAREQLSRGSSTEPPPALRDAHYAGASTLGHGDDYRYPHDFQNGWVAQQYLPDGVTAGDVYQAVSRGREALLLEQWRRRRGNAESDALTPLE